MRNLAIPVISLALLSLSFAAVAAQSQEPVETIEVKHAETKRAKHESLRFLKDHRVFLRAQLDQLRLQITRVREGEADLIDQRYLMLREMAAAIAAARDTIRAEQEIASERDLLDSVTELGDLEAQLALMDSLLADQRERLLMLEQDFLGRQETALVVLVKGLTGSHTPTSITLTEDNDVVRIDLDADQQESLQRGGVAQIFHEFVEPRTHLFRVGFEGWNSIEEVTIEVDAARDRMTFLELDLSKLDPERDAVGLVTNIWYR